jgi:hypothetical protein
MGMMNLFEMIVESNSGLRKDGGIVGEFVDTNKEKGIRFLGGHYVFISHVMYINKGIIWGYLYKGLLKFPIFKLSIFKAF